MNFFFLFSIAITKRTFLKKSTAKQLSNTIKRSFFCKPKSSNVNYNTINIPLPTTSTNSTKTVNSINNITNIDASNILNNSINSVNLLSNKQQQQQPSYSSYSQSKHSTLASFTSQQPYLITSPTTTINTGQQSTSSKLSPCCSSKKDLERNKVLYRKPGDFPPAPTGIYYQQQQQQYYNQSQQQQQQQSNSQILSNNLSLTRKSADSFNSNKSLMNLSESKQQQQQSADVKVATFEYNNDEHRLISRYTSRLANYYTTNQQNEVQNTSMTPSNTYQQQQQAPVGMPSSIMKHQSVSYFIAFLKNL